MGNTNNFMSCDKAFRMSTQWQRDRHDKAEIKASVDEKRWLLKGQRAIEIGEMSLINTRVCERQKNAQNSHT